MEKSFKDTMTENFPDLTKETDIQIQEMQGDSDKTNPKKPIPSNVMIRMPKV